MARQIGALAFSQQSRDRAQENPDSLFAELGRTLHQYQVNQDRNALADTLASLGKRMKE